MEDKCVGLKRECVPGMFILRKIKSMQENVGPKLPSTYYQERIYILNIELFRLGHIIFVIVGL